MPQGSPGWAELWYWFRLSSDRKLFCCTAQEFMGTMALACRLRSTQRLHWCPATFTISSLLSHYKRKHQPVWWRASVFKVLPWRLSFQVCPYQRRMMAGHGHPALFSQRQRRKRHSFRWNGQLYLRRTGPSGPSQAGGWRPSPGTTHKPSVSQRKKVTSPFVEMTP